MNYVPIEYEVQFRIFFFVCGVCIRSVSHFLFYLLVQFTSANSLLFSYYGELYNH